MSKRLLWFVIFLVLLAFAALAYFFKDQIFTSRQAFDAIPESAAVVIDLSRPADQLTEYRQDSIWRSLQNYKLIDRLNLHVGLLDSIFDNSQDQALLEGTSLLVAAEKSSAHDFSLLYVLDAGNVSIEPAREPDQDARKYNGYQVVTYTYGGHKMHVVETGNLLIGSLSEFLLEKSIDQLDGHSSLLSDPDFEKARQLGQKNDAPKCYFNLDNFPDLLSTVLANPSSRAAAQMLQNFGAWVTLDFTPLGNDLFINGYLIAEGQQGLLSQFEEGGGFESDITDVLPFNTAMFYSLNAQSFGKLVNGTDKAATARPIFEEYFVNWLGNNAGMGIVEPFSTDFQSNIFLVAEVADTFLALNKMQALAAKNVTETKVEPQEYKGMDIYQIQDFDHLEACLGMGSNLIKDPYFVRLDRFMVFANSISDLKVLIERYLGQETLDQDLDFLAFRDQMTKNASLTFFINTSRAYHLLDKVANDTFSSYLKDHFAKIRSLNPIGLQFSSYNKQAYLINGYIQSYSTFQQSSNLVWKTELDTNATYSPVVVTNHDDGSNEIFTQDAYNQVYLISSGGRVLWKRQLDGPIIGEVHQVDFYRNGKLQYLFTTTQSIYLIDRLGRDVENFPLTLPSKVTTGLSVFDYNRNGKYRMFLGCANNNIYGFYKSGKPLPGWSPKRMEAQVPHAIDHFLVDVYDYIMTLNADGKLRLLNRQAEDRLGPFELETAFAQPFAVEIEDGDNFKLVNCDESGILYEIINGKKVVTDTLIETFGRVVFRYRDITGDGEEEYILKDAFKLVAFDQNQELLFEYQLPDALEEDIFFATLKDEAPMIGLYSRANELIYLVKSSGLLYDQFPLSGSTPFSIAPMMAEDEWLVITGMKDRTITTYRVK